MTGTVTFLSPKIVGVIAVSVDVVPFGASGRVKIFYTTGISTARSLRSFRYCSVGTFGIGTLLRSTSITLPNRLFLSNQFVQLAFLKLLQHLL